MANRWGIPKEIEKIVLARDLSCVYCRVTFIDSDQNKKTRRTWEHIINDIRINGADNPRPLKCSARITWSVSSRSSSPKGEAASLCCDCGLSAKHLSTPLKVTYIS